jgi:pyruvate kinase
MSRLRDPVPILAFTDVPATRSRNALLWGVETFLVERAPTTDALMAVLDETLLGTGLAQKGERVVVTAGAPPGLAGSTNDVRVHIVGTGGTEILT